MKGLMKRVQLAKTKVEVKEYSFENETYYKIVEKGFLLGIRLYKDEFPKKYYVLRNAIEAAERVHLKIEKENLVGLVGTKTVFTVE